MTRQMVVTALSGLFSGFQAAGQTASEGAAGAVPGDSCVDSHGGGQGLVAWADNSNNEDGDSAWCAWAQISN